MQITKISHKPKEGTTLVRWTDAPDLMDDGPEVSGLDRHEIESEGTPHPDFFDALQSLRLAFERVCALPPFWCQSLTVRGLTATYNADGDRRVLVTATRLVSDGLTMSLNTPLFEDSDDPGLFDAVERALAEGRAYVRGKRAQAGLFDGDASGDGQTGGIDSMTISDRTGRSITLTRKGMENLSGGLSRELDEA